MRLMTEEDAAREGWWLRLERNILRVTILLVTALVIAQVYHHHKGGADAREEANQRESLRTER